MILVYIEQDRGKVNEASFETLTFARALAEQTSVPLHAITIGSASPELTERLGAFGVSTLHLAKHEAFSEYAPDAYATSIVEVAHARNAQAQNAQTLLAAGTERGNEIMARAAARLNVPFAANVVEARAGDALMLTRLRWGGSLLEQAKLVGAPKVLTVALNAVAPKPADKSTNVETREFAPALDTSDMRVRVTQRVDSASGKISLGEARVVVGGGRGVGSAEGFKELEELANLLGGAVGGSRVVTGLGWRPHADQIGQTGNRIQPDLYISCGVSGAIQHMVGAKGAKHILAINTDPDAPIMFKADYAVIGDLHQIVPAISAEIKKRRSTK